MGQIGLISHSSRCCHHYWCECAFLNINDPLIVCPFLFLFVCGIQFGDIFVELGWGVSMENPDINECSLLFSPETNARYIESGLFCVVTIQFHIVQREQLWFYFHVNTDFSHDLSF